MSQCLGKIHCKTLEFELEIDFDSLWQGYCTSPHFFFNTYSQGAPQIVKTQVVVKLRHTLRHSTCVSLSFGIIEPHKILGVSRASWLLFTGVLAWFVVSCLRCPGPLGSCSPLCPLGVVRCACGVPGPLAPVHRCARWVCCVACVVSWATWLLFAVRLLRVLLCVRGVLGHLAPVHRCACSVFCFACAVSRATWLLFTGVPARFLVSCLRCPGPLGSCSSVCPLGVLCCVCGDLVPLAPAHRCARWVCCVACASSWATRLLVTAALARCVALRARCPGPLGSCSPVCQAVVSRLLVALGVRACAVSWPSWRPFTGVRAVCGARVPLVVVSLFPPPEFFFSFFF